MESSSDPKNLHVFFFPYLAVGHMFPVLEIARLFADRPGVTASFVTTPANVARVQHVADDAVRRGRDMRILVVPFPEVDGDSAAVIPAGCENTNSLPSAGDDAILEFYRVTQLLRRPLEDLLRDHRPDCLVADEMYPWTADLALSLGIPRILYLATSHFNVYVANEIEDLLDFDSHVAGCADDEPFAVPGLPHDIRITKSEYLKHPKHVLDIFRDSEAKSHGRLTISFDELAPDYLRLFHKRGKKIWNVGPVAALPGRMHGNRTAKEYMIKEWLDSKEEESVLFVAFGTECVFSDEQLREIAAGLVDSGCPFVWEVRAGGGGLETIEEWLPEKLEEKIEGRGLILRGGAPQLLILNHPSVGGFLTHCGSNSTSEALTAGVPMIAWPLNSDQFVTERLVVQVLGAGVSSLDGVRRSVFAVRRETVRAEAVRKAVERVMGGGDEAGMMRRRAKEYARMARAAVGDERGSSCVNLTSLVEELRAMAVERRCKAEGSQ